MDERLIPPYMDNMIEERSAGVLVFRENDEREYLLLHYPAGHWDYPKGHVEEGESEQETALRELREETGVDKDSLELVEGFRKSIDYIYRKGRELSHKEVIYLLGKTEKRRIKLSREHQDFDWLTYQDAMERLTFRNAKEVLEMARKYLEKDEDI